MASGSAWNLKQDTHSFRRKTVLAHLVNKQHEHKQLEFSRAAVYFSGRERERDFGLWLKFGWQQQTFLSVGGILSELAILWGLGASSASLTLWLIHRSPKRVLFIIIFFNSLNQNIFLFHEFSSDIGSCLIFPKEFCIYLFVTPSSWKLILMF